MRDRSGLSDVITAVRTTASWRWRGRLVEANAQTVESIGPPCGVGECCEITDVTGTRHAAEVIGFRGRHVVAMPLITTAGLAFGDSIAACGYGAAVRMSDAMLGHVYDASGEPMDGSARVTEGALRALDADAPAAMGRVPVREPLGTGVRALDALLTTGRGQRVGLFGGSGVGKSTLIGMMTRGTVADVTVVGLVGERGREVREFLEEALGAEGLKRSVVFVSTSDQSPLLRMRAAMAATSAAEYFAAQGKDVLLVLDSLTRYAMAARELGLAAGEPPASKGYTPGVFARLARLVERAGRFNSGSITAVYTVLMEGDDQQDPIVDCVRSLLDGHVVLSRKLAVKGQYPPIDVVDSLSRLMPSLVSAEHQERAMLVRRLLAARTNAEDLIRLGAYSAGSDAELDRAIRAEAALRRLSEQKADEVCPWEANIGALLQAEL